MKLAYRPVCSVLIAALLAGCAGTSESNGGKKGTNGAGEEKKDGGVKIGAAAGNSDNKKADPKTGEAEKPERQWWNDSDALNKGLCAVGGNIMLNAGMISSARLAANAKAKQNLQANLKRELSFCIRIWAKSCEEADAKAIQAIYQDPKFLSSYVSVVKNSVVVKMRTPKGGRGTLFVLMTVKANNVYDDFLKAVVKTNTQLRINKKAAPSKKAEEKLSQLGDKLKVRLAQTQDALAKEYEFSGWAAAKTGEAAPK